MIRAVLFDIGGPIDLEIEHERLIDRHIREALAAPGRVVSDEEYEAANRAAVASFAPNAYRAILWSLSGGDPALARQAFDTLVARTDEREQQRGGIELRPGIAELLVRLHERGLRMGLVANQARAMLEELARHGIARYFAHLEVSGVHGLRKPDPRAFLRACTLLEVAPAEAIMVGDRIDNDIAPALALGMSAIRLRSGRHAEQQPRAWDEVPDADVTSVAELESAIIALVERA